jgi:hypothetical protein
MNSLRPNSTTIENKKNLSQISDLHVMFNTVFSYCCAISRQANPTSAELFFPTERVFSCEIALVPSGDVAMMDG